MNSINQWPERSISKVCSSLAGGVIATYIMVTGNAPVSGSRIRLSTSHEVFFYDRNNLYPKEPTDTWNYSLNNSSNVAIPSTKSVVNENMLDNLRKLNKISSLKDNWNLNGARAFSDKLMEKVRTLIFYLDIQPEIFPTACNSLQFEYDKEDGSHMEIEINDTDNAEVFTLEKDGRERITNIKASSEMINKTVAKFYG